VGKAVLPGLCEDRQLLSLLSLAKIRLSTPSCHGGTILTTPLMRGLSLQQEEGAHAVRNILVFMDSMSWGVS